MADIRNIENFAKSNAEFSKVLAGKISTQDFFTKPEYTDSKNAFIQIYREFVPDDFKSTLYSEEALAAAWITKLRYNEKLTDEEFFNYIQRSENIFNPGPSPLVLNLKTSLAKDNDLCAIMWGLEALNGIQSYNNGSTRVRFPEGVAPQIFNALQDAGATLRSSTHATGTKLTKKGLGKDLPQEELRQYTPRGMGAILVVPTSKNGEKSASLEGVDYDLLLKEEDYGYNDSTLHNHVHSKMDFLNYLDQYKDQYFKSLLHLNVKSRMFIAAELKEGGGGKPIHRKEHLSELKDDAPTLISLLDAGKKLGLFEDFTTKWTIRIKWPPFEKKIVGSDSSCKGLGEFLSQLASLRNTNPLFEQNNRKELAKVEGLLNQAQQSQGFEKCREGNEVLVDCTGKTAVLIDTIAKNSSHEPVDRMKLEATLVSSVDPDASKKSTLSFKEQMRQREPLEPTIKNDTPTEDHTTYKSPGLS